MDNRFMGLRSFLDIHLRPSKKLVYRWMLTDATQLFVSFTHHADARPGEAVTLALSRRAWAVALDRRFFHQR